MRPIRRCSLLLALGIWLGAGAMGSAAEPLRFFAIGDLPYRESEEEPLRRLLASAVAQRTPFIVHVGDILVLQLGIGGGIDGLNYPLSRVALEKLKLTEGDLDTLRLRVTTELQRSEELLNVDSSAGR